MTPANSPPLAASEPPPTLPNIPIPSAFAQDDVSTVVANDASAQSGSASASGTQRSDRRAPRAAQRAGERRVFTDTAGSAPYSELIRRKLDQCDSAAHRDALPPGFILGDFLIEEVLGVGGFGVTYLGRDTLLNTPVAVKEYLPVGLALRGNDQPLVWARRASDEVELNAGLQRFLNESRTLAAFRHRNIVRVTRFFEANRTAYMVMDYELGLPLSSWLGARRGDAVSDPAVGASDASGQPLGAPDERTLKAMFRPLLDGISKMHDVGFLHRDIKPANIFVRDEDGSLVLLDFGAARRVQDFNATDSPSKGLTSIVSPGYAPFEQYYEYGRQGPWSDIYALGGVWYWMVTGHKPVEAAARINKDPQVPAEELGKGRYSVSFLRLIDRMMLTDDTTRPQSIAEVLTGFNQRDSDLDGATPAHPLRRSGDHVEQDRRGPRVVPANATADPIEPIVIQARPASTRGSRAVLIGSILILVAAVVFGGLAAHYIARM